MKKLFVFLYPFLFSLVCQAQVHSSEFDSLMAIAIDAPESITQTRNLDNIQRNWLKKITSQHTESSSELLPIVRYVHANKNFSPQQLSTLIHRKLNKKSNSPSLDLNYVRIRWHELKSFRDDGDLKKANRIHKELKTYVASFKQKNKTLQKAKLLLRDHDIVLSLISKKIDAGMRLADKSIAQAKSLNDTNLWILSMFNKCDFYIYTGQLNEFIEMSEYCYHLDSIRVEKSFFYMPNLMHLVDAYIYEGQHVNRSLLLLERIHSDQNYTIDSYTYFMKLLANTDPRKLDTTAIFSLVDAHNFLAFHEKTKALSNKWLTPLDYFQFLRETSYALYQYGHAKLGLNSMEEATAQIRRIYSADLSKTIAEHEKNKIEYKKNEEIKNTQKLAELYKWSAILVCAFALIALITLLRKMRQNKILNTKNLIISKKEKEKSLLMRELNHRVKNNFQIISSVLAMQARAIDDPRVKEVFSESQSRISAMALTHEKLHNKDNSSHFLKVFIDDLLSDLKWIPKSQNLSIDKSIDDSLEINLESAIPIGLIINELITNTVKHSMKDDEKVTITLSSEKTETGMRISYSDSGFGIEHGIDFDSDKTLGIKLIRSLTRQINGKVQYSKESNSFEFDLPHDVFSS